MLLSSTARYKTLLKDGLLHKTLSTDLFAQEHNAHASKKWFVVKYMADQNHWHARAAGMHIPEELAAVRPAGWWAVGTPPYNFQSHFRSTPELIGRAGCKREQQCSLGPQLLRLSSVWESWEDFFRDWLMFESPQDHFQEISQYLRALRLRFRRLVNVWEPSDCVPRY
jgi:hypothetical protein